MRKKLWTQTTGTSNKFMIINHFLISKPSSPGDYRPNKHQTISQGMDTCTKGLPKGLK